MNKNQQNWLSMSLSVKVFCAQLSAIFALIPGFTALETLLGNTITKIQELAIIQISGYKGKTALKAFLRMDLIGKTMTLVRALIAYARLHELIEFYEAVSYTESRLKKMPASTLIAVCQLIQDKAGDVIDDLDEFGITQVILDTQKKAISDFSAGITGPREGIIIKKNATMALKVCFKDGREVILKMDDLAGSIKNSNTEAYNSYKNARVIVDYRKGKRSGDWYLEGKAVDFESGYPVAGVSVSIVGTAIVVITQLDGIFRLKVPGPGQYQVRGEHPNYSVNLKEVTLIGEAEEIVMEMERVAEE
jgi:hypothetical protein